MSPTEAILRLLFQLVVTLYGIAAVVAALVALAEGKVVAGAAFAGGSLALALWNERALERLIQEQGGMQ